MGQDSPDDPGGSMPFVQIDGDEFVVRPVVDASGIGFYSEDDRKMIMNHGAVSIGDVPVPQNPTQSLEVHPGSFITNRLHRFDERIEFKTIQTDPVGPDHLSYIHSSANIVQHLSFDYDTGFDISTPEDYVVDISFQEHFSTYNTIRLDDDMDADTQFITPNGIDSMIYKASFISASANNVISVNSDRTEDVNEDAMDSLTFFNDLVNGGVIDGNLAISATLNVVSSGQHFDEQDYIAHGGEKGYLIGDISMMDDIPFPFKHVTTENGVVVHHEYVITENVGIGTSLPAFPLEVDGVTSVNVVISPSINVTGEFVSNKNYLNVLSEQNIYVTLNASAQHTGSLLYLNDMEIKDAFFGLNQLDEDYMMSLYTTDVGTHSDMFIQGNTRSMVSFHEVFNLVLDGDDQFHIKGLDPVQRLLFTFDESSMVVADSKLGIDMLTAPKNSLDVAGNMVIGRSLAGRVQAPPNSLMIEGQLGIGTVLPDAMTDVQGSMVQGFSSSYLGDITGLENDLVIQRRLIVEDFTSDDTESSVLVSGRIVGTGGLYFNKNSNPLNNELSFYNREDDRLIIGYGDAITNRSLHINVVDYLTFNPKDDGQANELTIDSSAKVGFGTKTPESLFHVQKDGLAFKVEALLNAAVKFESGDHGLMGFSIDIPDQFILTDGDAFGTEVAGADFSMDADGALDIGYNIKDESAALPSHDVLMDVNGHINASAVLENGAVMTHMPEGSIVMWSGWTSELPDGWVLCDGLTDGVPNLQDYFVLGKSDSNSYEDTVGAGNHEFVIEVSDDYQHTHGSSHGHGSFSTTNHNHGRITPGATNAKATNIAGANAGAPTMRRNANGVEMEKEDKWENVDWENCTGSGLLHHGLWCPMETYWVDFSKKSAYSTPTTANGHHGHPVNVSHSHNVDIHNENGHNHTLGSQSHVHENIKHTHTANLEPVYYTLAFIYLKGDPVVSDTGAQP